MAEKKLERLWPPELSYDYNAMNLEKALVLTEAAIKKSEELKIPMTIAVGDAAGNIVSLQRMDDAALLSLEIAQNKVKTAVFGKIPSMVWGNFFKGTEPILTSLYFHSNWITFNGGFPIVMGDKIIGGLGCSGGTWEDGIVARAALMALGADLSGVEDCLKADGVPKDMW